MPVNRGSRTVTHSRNAAAVQIQDRERLQDIIQLARREGNRDVLLITNWTHMLKITNTILVKNHSFYGKIVGDRKGGLSSSNQIPPLGLKTKGATKGEGKESLTQKDLYFPNFSLNHFKPLVDLGRPPCKDNFYRGVVEREEVLANPSNGSVILLW